MGAAGRRHHHHAEPARRAERAEPARLIELNDAVRRAEFDTAVRSLIITGAGRGFPDGADVKEWGAGGDIALATDLRIASTAARFGRAYSKLDYCPDAGGSYLLPWLIGEALHRANRGGVQPPAGSHVSERGLNRPTVTKPHARLCATAVAPA